jgi:hypothetical protein
VRSATRPENFLSDIWCAR